MTWIGWTGRGDPYWLALAALGDEDDVEERIERAWLGRVLQRRRERERFAPSVLTSYPLTQPPDNCQRCLRWTGADDAQWDLDHIVELQLGGLDHPTNLVRLCIVCHRSKPLPPEQAWGDPETMRSMALAWIRMGPPGGVRPPLRAGLSQHEAEWLDAEMATWRAENTDLLQ